MRLLSRLPLSIASLASMAAAQPARRPLAIEDYYRVKTITTPTISPDGKWVAYGVMTRVEETNGSQTAIWLVPSDASTAARRVSAEGVNAISPGWQDDGRLRFNTGGHVLVVDPANPDRADT